MNFSQFLLILRARYKIVLFVLGVTVATTLLVSLLMPKKYQASVTLVLNYKGIDPVTGLTLPAQLMPGYMATQVDIISSISTALKVVDDLRLADDEESKRDFMDATDGQGDFRLWQANQLLKKLDVVPSRDSSVLSIDWSAPDPQFAAVVANAFANAYQEISIQVKVDPSKKAALYFHDQIRLLRDNVEAAQKKLSQFQQENGIVATDSRIDSEVARLTALSTQLAQAQTQTLESASRKADAQGGRAEESPDVFANPLIQSLKAQLAQAELKLSSLAQKTTEEHPHYQAAKAEAASLRAELQRQVQAGANSLASNARILRQREAELRKTIEEQKATVLKLNQKRDELKTLNNELDSAQRYYEAASQRFMQTNLEGQSNQADAVVLTRALPPLKAASPNMLLNLSLSLFLGAMLGLGFAMLAEMINRRVRSTDDLVKALQAPVLGVMEWEKPRPRRLGFSRLLLTYRPLSN